VVDGQAMSDHLPTPVLEGLADTLWQERHMVERLLYRMVTAHLLLAADEHRFVSVAIDEVEDVVAALRSAEGQRLAALQEVADRLQLPVEDLSLSEIIRLAPPALQPVFTDHRTAFLALTAEIEQTAEANRHLASSALGRLQRSLDALAGADPMATYNAAGRTERTPAPPRQLDRAL
jgi:hypothetical protein